MKTKSTNTAGLPSRSEQSRTPTPDAASRRPTIDFELRDHNRNLPTQQVLALIRSEAPNLWDLAQVVGKWIWIQFSDKQPPEVTTVLAQLGFHWNNKRQVWQHPCGPVTVDASPDDPRTKYGAFHPSDAQPA